MINVAAYNGLNCHHEMIGYVMAHCHTRPDIVLTVFTTSGVDFGWIRLYSDRFPGVPFQPIRAFSSAAFDHVVLLTDDDTSFPSLGEKERSKVLCIDHFHRIRRFQPMLRRISTRYFSDRTDAQYVLPTYCLVDETDKRLALSSMSGSNPEACISIVCIGAALEDFATMQQFVLHVQGLFPHNLSVTGVGRPLHFHLFHRRSVFPGEPDDHNLTVTRHNAADAGEMVAILRLSDYVLMGDGEARRQQALSGSCPLAYSCGCRLISSDLWKTANKLRSPIVFAETQTQALEPLGDCAIEDVYRESVELWSHRDDVLGSYLR